ncbi:CXXC motif containing zinc binding protein [Parasteatoda tepidariorum]|uniref:CXXC motif containing zinc binding protein n=1 Tax=Parasteatoda tepidariorum TaxID=114398 RepID=UPI00077FD070|nr:CXXC motif containing zinc binding protein [Parasteatoda tepidariorum]
MGKIGLQFKAVLENVTDLQAFGEDFRWYLKLKCLNCGEEPEKWQYVALTEKFPLKGGRGEANFVSKCKLCARENSVEILLDTIKKYTIDDSESFKTIVVFDCRGLEPTDFSPRVGFQAIGENSNALFDDINLEEKEWVDYDEKANLSVSIAEVEHKFVKV